MSEMNSINNRAVWFDIPVVDLDRAAAFYRAVLGIRVDKLEFNGCNIGIFEHEHGNGGCLVPNLGKISSDGGILLYMNVNGRIHDAVKQVEVLGGTVL